MKYVALILFVLIVAALGPVLTIWSWNTLFGSVHTIPYTFETWAAVVIIGGLFKTSISKKD